MNSRVADLVDVGGERRPGERSKLQRAGTEAIKRKDETMKENIIHAVEAFLNSKRWRNLADRS